MSVAWTRIGGSREVRDFRSIGQVCLPRQLHSEGSYRVGPRISDGFCVVGMQVSFKAILAARTCRNHPPENFDHSARHARVSNQFRWPIGSLQLGESIISWPAYELRGR